VGVDRERTIRRFNRPCVFGNRVRGISQQHKFDEQPYASFPAAKAVRIQRERAIDQG
jgi:hypothetical protein